jgi:hypothetical protein
MNPGEGERDENQAAIFRVPNQPLTVEEVEVDEPGPREVLVRTDVRLAAVVVAGFARDRFGNSIKQQRARRWACSR